MRYRISTALVLIAVIAVSISAFQRLNSLPRNLRILIEHLEEMPKPCSSVEFDDYIARCDVPVIPRQGNDSLVFWSIGRAKPQSSAGGSPQQSGAQQAAGDVIYGMLTEHASDPQSDKSSISAVRVYSRKLEMGAGPIEKILWSWNNE